MLTLPRTLNGLHETDPHHPEGSDVTRALKVATFWRGKKTHGRSSKSLAASLRLKLTNQKSPRSHFTTFLNSDTTQPVLLPYFTFILSAVSSKVPNITETNFHHEGILVRQPRGERKSTPLSRNMRPVIYSHGGLTAKTFITAGRYKSRGSSEGSKTMAHIGKIA